MSDLTFISAAATRVGEEPVTSLDDGSLCAKIAAENYDGVVKAALSGYRWHFAARTVGLAMVTGEAPQPWLYGYQLPTDLIGIRTVKWCGRGIAYERMTDKIVTNVGPDATVVLHYTASVPETAWPAEFGEYITIRMETLFLRGIGDRHSEASARESVGNDWIALARRQDAQSQPGTDPTSSPTLAARLGGTCAATHPVTWR